MSPHIQGVFVEEAERWPCRLSGNCGRSAAGFVVVEGKPDMIPACVRCMRSVANDYVTIRIDEDGGTRSDVCRTNNGTSI